MELSKKHLKNTNNHRLLTRTVKGRFLFNYFHSIIFLKKEQNIEPYFTMVIFCTLDRLIM